MKKLFVYLAVFGLIGLQACKEADGVDPMPSDPEVIGVWNFDGLTLEDGVVSFDGQPFITMSSQSSNEVGTIEFKEDGNAVSNIGYDNTATTTFLGNTSTETENIPQTTETQQYSYDKNAGTLTWYMDSTEVVYTVTELTDSKMTLYSDVKSSEEDQGVTTTVEAKLTWSLSK